MHLRLEELARLVGGQVVNHSAAVAPVITGAAAVGEAQEGEITFFGNVRYLAALKASKATCALVPVGFKEEIPAIAIEVENPSLAFATVLAHFAPAPITFKPGIHPSAVVDETAEVHPSATIRANAVIEAGVKIGAGTVIGPNVTIGHRTTLGADCHIHANVSIYDRMVIGDRVTIHSGTVVGSDGYGYEQSQGRHVKIPQTGIVQIDNDVEIGANGAIDRARFGRTWIGEGTKIDNLVQIAHNVVIGKHSIIVAQVGISGSTRIGNYVTLAGQVGVAGHLEIGDQVVVGAQAGIGRNVAPKEVLWGSPAVAMREQQKRLVYIGRLSKIWSKIKALESTTEKLSAKVEL